MLLTIVYGEQVTCIEISPDMELENFVGLCLIEIPPCHYWIVGNDYAKANKGIRTSDGDAVSIEQVPPQQSQHQGSTVQSQPSSAQFFRSQTYFSRFHLVEKLRLMHDENSEEGQRFIADRLIGTTLISLISSPWNICRKLLSSPHALHSYEDQQSSSCAFIDSGAQGSILSESCAKRCNISRLVDTRYRLTAIGIGGSQSLWAYSFMSGSSGGNIFPCSFDVIGDRDMDILFDWMCCAAINAISI
uniref:Aspartic peptidase DDI1-type domain-containing protein n=1 Tax=Ditylenchus dipsaci TaxID=166011 RepID=A0A915DT44_9BILA